MTKEEWDNLEPKHQEEMRHNHDRELMSMSKKRNKVSNAPIKINPKMCIRDSCFSDDCPDVTIGTIFKILRETLDENGKQKYKPYLGPIFKDDGLEEFILEFADVLEKTETSIEQAQEIQMDKVCLLYTSRCV